ncbi:glycosyltransferase [Brevibacillus laterosporus]
MCLFHIFDRWRYIRSIDDEIVIVDTGSTDRTREIALTYEASVIQTEWENDFSKACEFSTCHYRVVFNDRYR